MRHHSIAMAGLRGCLTALPTPFIGGALDETGFRRLCAWQGAQGAAGLVVASVVGEAPTLLDAEQIQLIRLAVAECRVPVLAGIVANATRQAIDLARAAARAGADGLLAVVPYYNRPGQDGLLAHFRALHDAVGIPILVHDLPARAGCRLAEDTIVALAELPRVVGLVDGSGDLARPSRLRRRLGLGFRLFAGDDATALGYLAQGGDGMVSATAAVAPKLCGRLYAAWARGDVSEAGLIAALLSQLTAALASDSEPVPAKVALHLLGHLPEEVRLPLCPAAPATRQAVADALARLGLIGMTHGRSVRVA